MPLTQKVTFRTMLQRGNRVKVPKLVRLQFKVGTDQVLKIGVGTRELGIWHEWESFYGLKFPGNKWLEGIGYFMKITFFSFLKCSSPVTTSAFLSWAVA